MTGPITVRTGTAADAPAVAALHAASQRSAYAGIVPDEALGDGLPAQRQEIWALRLTVDYGGPEHTPTLLVAEDGEGPVGFAYLVPEPDGRTLLDNLHVRPGRTGGGIGRLLLRAALERTAPAPLRLEVLRENRRAIAFYEREGGRRTAERTGFFPGGHELPEYEYTWDGAPLTGRTP
ncbi:GNAT family N-acetyltransferase [Kitasatospora sp. NPDC059571]|uniref:GNAT family N-acetyltransferase n=1 Tax=Kitasatospora sp. NPDC059571 TaxID=3346871 RepID=UPI0036795E58